MKWQPQSGPVAEALGGPDRAGGRKCRDPLASARIFQPDVGLVSDHVHGPRLAFTPRVVPRLVLSEGSCPGDAGEAAALVLDIQSSWLTVEGDRQRRPSAASPGRTGSRGCAGRRGWWRSNPRARPGFRRASASIRPTFAGSSRSCKRHPGDRPSLRVWTSLGGALESPRELLRLGTRALPLPECRVDAVRDGRARHTVGVGSLRGPA
jgi:hypothetical protein